MQGEILRKGKKYIDGASQQPIKDAATIRHIEALRIPPGYKNVAINKNLNGKILAYGFDKKGRKQTIYSKWYVENQQKKKFKRIMKMRDTFERIARHIKKHLQIKPAGAAGVGPGGTVGAGTSKKWLICLILQLMLLCNFRIGCEKYARENKTYGLTTLEWKHIHFLPNGTVHIKFNGKKNVCNESTIRDRNVIRYLKHLSRNYAPNAKVFQYRGVGGATDGGARMHPVRAADVNEYLAKFSVEITCKDLRTWNANCLYIRYYSTDTGELNIKKRQLNAIKKVALDLHNTPAVCRSNYISPELIK